MLAIFATLGLLTIVVAARDPTQPETHRRAAAVLACLVGATFIQMVAAPIQVGSDLERYFTNSLELGELGLFEALRVDDRAPLFVLSSWAIGVMSDSGLVFKGFWSGGYLILLLVAIRRVMPPWETLVTFFLYLNFPIFFDYGLAAIRQGVAMSLLALALAGLATERPGLMYIGVLVAPLFHWVALPFSGCILVSKFWPGRETVYAAVWIGAVLVFLLEAQAALAEPLVAQSEMLQGYSSARLIESYGGATRTDFLVPSVLAGVYGLVALRWVASDRGYRTILRYYLSANTVFLLFSFVAFSDRVASFSWFVLPLVVAYPVLNGGLYRRWHGVGLVVGGLAVGLVFGLLNDLS